MSLPLPWVDRIFDKLTLTYGQAFLARWRDIDIEKVKADWAHELAGLETAPHCISYALTHLVEKPPSVIEFRAMCRSAPAADLPRLPEPPADPQRVAQELNKLQASKQQPLQSIGNKDWARRIVQRVREGDKTVRRAAHIMAMDALGLAHGG